MNAHQFSAGAAICTCAFSFCKFLVGRKNLIPPACFAALGNAKCPKKNPFITFPAKMEILDNAANQATNLS
uniref:Uncharacterized protein n=1 Tax=Rhizophora mucronata TaxID=61149 RepID=A0A2P2Q2M8_RHIMU